MTIKYSTFQSIVDDMLVDGLEEDSKNVLSGFKESELITLHHTLGQDIRNKYELWNPEHPLTKGYEEDEDLAEPKHPDTVSFKIIKAIHAELT
jgi:hypothetical protein